MASPTTTILCGDRGCASTAAATPAPRIVAERRVLMSRRGSVRTDGRVYVRRRVLEAEPRQARNEPVSPPRQAIEPVRRHGGGVVTIETAANPITVSAGIAGQMRDLISDLVAHGYRGHVTCLASGHMPHSLHHSGEACDFGQLARNRVSAGAGLMYHASSIIAAHGLRDGCGFRDCGHVDSGRMNFVARAQYVPGGMARIRHYARRYYGHRFYRTAGPRYAP